MTTNTTKAPLHLPDYDSFLKIHQKTLSEMKDLLAKFTASCMAEFTASCKALYNKSVSQLPPLTSSPENTPRSLTAAVTSPPSSPSETIQAANTVAQSSLGKPSATSQNVPAITDAVLPSPTAALSLQQANPVHKTAKLTWGSYIYTVEQDLPPETTDQQWEQIVKAYADLLNKTTSTADCHAGIEKLFLSLDHGTVNITVPDETPDPSRPEKRNKIIPIESNTEDVQEIVLFLTSVLTKTSPLEISRTLTDESKLVSANTAETAPASEVIESREILPLSPPLRLRNPTIKLCYLNSLIQMIMASPHLQAQFMTSPQLVEHLTSYSRPEKPNSYISSLDTTGLDSILFPATSTTPYIRQQRDVVETLGALVYQLPTEEIGKFEIKKRIIKAFELTKKGTDFASFTKKHDLRDSKREPDIFLQNSYESSLPLLKVTPNGTNRTLLKTIQQQHCQTQNQVSGDKSTLTSDEAGGTQFTLRDVISKFTTTPQTLFIHADRTNLTDTSINRNGINLEETLLLPGSLFSQNRNTIHYELRSFTVHEGTDYRQGHYISYVRIPGKNNESRYYKLDDLHPEEEAEITKREFLDAAQNFTLAAFDLASSRENPTKEPNIQNPSAATVSSAAPKGKSPHNEFYEGPVRKGPSKIEELD